MWNIIQDIFVYFLIFIFSLTVFIYFYYKNAFQYWVNLDIPHPKPSFPFGNMNINFSKKIGQLIHEIYAEMKNKGHKYCGYYMFAMPVFMPLSPNLNKHFLSVDYNCFNYRGMVSDEKNDPMGSSLVTWQGEKWKRMRDKLNPAWSAKKTKGFLPFMLKCTNDIAEVIEEKAQKRQPININDIAKRFTVDVICTCAFGIDGNCLKDPNADFIRHAKMIFTTNIKDNMRLALGQSAPTISKLFKINLFNPTATGFFQKAIQEAVDYRKKNNMEREDFLNLMIRLKNKKSIKDGEEHSNKLIDDGSDEVTDDIIASSCFVFFVGGFETTSTTIQYIFYELAKNEDIQEKLRKDVMEILKKYDNKYTYESIQDMRYLDNVFHETLRKYPVVHMLNRECTSDFTIPETNIIIKKGTKAVLSTLGIHMDPEYYPNPEIFDPDRFTDEAKAARPSFVYLPFGDGPRICPAFRFGKQEVKLCVASLIVKFKFALHPSFDNIKFCSFGNVLGTEKPIILSATHV